VDARSVAHSPPSAPSAHRPLRAAAALLLVVGLLGHVYAAYAMGGSRIAYTHHVLGFFLILAVTGGILALAGWRLWRTRAAVMLFVIALVQALLGLWIGSATLRA